MKLIAILPVRDEEWIIRQNLETLSQVCDVIFVADQHSVDRTAEICREFDKVHYLQQNEQYKLSLVGKNRRQILLDAARDYEGENVILAVDADEIITSTALSDPSWRTLLESLDPGDSVELQWVMLWKHSRRYREDRSIWSNRWVHFVYRDDRKTNYADGNWHEPRVPQAFIANSSRCDAVKVLHYQFVAWERMLSKQCHCRMLELLQTKGPSTNAINQKYIVTKDERQMNLGEVPDDWVSGWLDAGIDLDHFSNPDLFWYDIEILRFFAQYGTRYFADLDIWDVDWERKWQLTLTNEVDGLPKGPVKDPRNLEQRLYHEYLHRYFSAPLWRRNWQNLPQKLLRRVGL